MKKIVMAGILFSSVISVATLGMAYSRPISANSEDVPVDEQHFPDKNFRRAASLYDKNKDGALSADEIEKVKTLDLLQCGIENLKGVEYFYALETLNLDQNMLTSLDLSANSALKTLNAYLNHIKEVKLPQDSKLISANLSYNFYLSDLDVSSCSDLEYLNCEGNGMATLNVTGCTKLNELNCSINSIRKLDLTSNKDLNKINCSGNKISELDLKNNPKLSEVSCGSNGMSKLLVSDSNIISELDISNNKLKNFDTSILKKLISLEIEGNNLGSFDLSKNPTLEVLDISSNNISSIDLSKGTKLKQFLASYNELTSIDFSHNTDLEVIWLEYNNLQSLDLSMLKKLEAVYVCNNFLTKIDFSKVPQLESFDVSDNPISTLDLRSNTKLEFVNCCNCHMEKLYLGNHPKLDTLLIFINNLDTVDITNCPALLQRLMENGIADCGTYYEGRYSEDPQAMPFIYIEIDKPVALKGYRLPNANPIEGSIADFVERLYSVALNRAPEATGKQYWVDAVTSGQKSGADCARFFLLDADEFMNRNLSNKDFLTTLYKTFFDREADSEGMQFYLKKLEEGTSRFDIVTFFIDSREWCDICACYGVKSGAPTAKATIANRNSQYFTMRLYRSCYGREADLGGLEYWSLALTNLEQTGATAAAFFFEGDEYLDLHAPEETYITDLYYTFMDRSPEDGAVDYWVKQMRKGMTRHDVLAFFTQCEEFDGICRKYAIEKGSI